VLLSIYSYARFGSFSEVGTSYQLQTIPELYESFNVQHRPPTNLANIPPLVALYLISAPSIGATPPYLGEAVLIPGSVMRLFGPDLIYVEGPMMSIFLITPIALFTLACPALFFMRWRPDLQPILAFIASLSLGGLLTLLLISTTVGISLRYTADLLPALTMAAALMLLLLVDRFLAPADAKRRGVGQVVTRYLIAFTCLSLVPSLLLALLSGLVAWGLPAPPWG